MCLLLWRWAELTCQVTNSLTLISACRPGSLAFGVAPPVRFRSKAKQFAFSISTNKKSTLTCGSLYSWRWAELNRRPRMAEQPRLQCIVRLYSLEAMVERRTKGHRFELPTNSSGAGKRPHAQSLMAIPLRCRMRHQAAQRRAGERELRYSRGEPVAKRAGYAFVCTYG